MGTGMRNKWYCGFLSFVGLLQVCQCSVKYDKVGNTAYYIGQGHTNEKVFDWFDARNSCWENDGELVSVLNPEQMFQLENYILSRGFANGSTFSTSGHSYDREYPFKWESLDQRLTYTKWLPGEKPEAECNLSLQLIVGDLYMIRSWGYDQYYICEYTTTWRSIQQYFRHWKIHYIFLFLIVSLILLTLHNGKTKKISSNLNYFEIKKMRV